MAPKSSVTIDPAYERYNQMREDVYKHFKWTRSTTRIAILSMVLIPGICVYTFAQQDTKYTWMGKQKGESLADK